MNPLLTLSTCWYNLKSKFPPQQYLLWIDNFLSIVKNFNLVIYTDDKSIADLMDLFKKYHHLINTKIKIIIKPLIDFYGYKYKEQWIRNHKASPLLLHKHIDWELNMLWCEKVHFVKETISNKYFETLYYGWCDIGYFRNKNDTILTMHTKDLLLKGWPNYAKLLTKEFLSVPIHYGCVQNDMSIYDSLKQDIYNHYYTTNINTNDSLIKDIQDIKVITDKYDVPCFAGGFFILRPNIITQYVQLFDDKLNYYFSNGYFVKDDQTILMDCIFNNPHLFCLHKNKNIYFDNWFMFHQILL